MKIKKAILIVGAISVAGYVYYKYIRPKIAEAKAQSIAPKLPADIGVKSIENTGVVYRNEGIIPQPVTPVLSAAIEAQRAQFQKVYEAIKNAPSSAVQSFLAQIKVQGFTVTSGKVKYVG